MNKNKSQQLGTQAKQTSRKRKSVVHKRPKNNTNFSSAQYTTNATSKKAKAQYTNVVLQKNKKPITQHGKQKQKYKSQPRKRSKNAKQ